MTMRVSLAELAAAYIPLRPSEAVAIVAEVCRQHSRGQLRGIPSPGVIRLTREGAVVAEGPTTTDEADVRRAGHLLNELLPSLDAPGDFRASGALRLVIARALGTLDLPPYATLQEFCEALSRFAVADLDEAVRMLFVEWERALATRRSAATAPELTISDIRRARRATGLSLDDLAEVADVPADRLRELEWGDLRNWRADEDGREEVRRYARAGGLDEEVVLAIAWPMIHEAGSAGGPARPVVGLMPSPPRGLPAARPAQRRGRGLQWASSKVATWGLAAAASGLLLFVAFSFLSSSAGAGTVGAEAVNLLTAPESPAVAAAPRGPAATRVSLIGVGAPARPAQLRSTKVPTKAPPQGRTRVRAGARPARAEPVAPPPARPKSILQRELFRILIR